MAKKFFSMIIIVVLTPLFISACSDNDEDLFQSFNFSLRFGYGGGINCIDTYNSTFTKDLIPGTETIQFIIPDDKLQEFYEAFLEYQIHNLPENISGEDRTKPAFTYIFTYTYGKRKKTIICENVDSIRYFSEKDTQKNFVSFADMIRDYIFATEEYENMTPVNGGYA